MRFSNCDPMNVHILIASLVSFLTAVAVFPAVLHVAKKYNVVDRPNQRKLQRVPVPVLGGVAVWLGLLAGFAVICASGADFQAVLTFAAMTIMMLVGTADDIKGLSASIRFLVEMALVWTVMMLSGLYIDTFHGLWGVHELGVGIAYPLSVLAGVGIINAINLIDGVDGYSSGFGMLAGSLFGCFFLRAGEYAFAALAFSLAAALVPFFLHNVFGKTSKMFLGDGGSLMVGMAMAMFVFKALSSKSLCAAYEQHGISVIAFTLAVMAIPVFDTLRVMSVRIMHKVSPFNPDKTHLHHMYVLLEFSHIGTTAAILASNILVILVGYLSWRLGASDEWQLYWVVGLSLIVTVGIYKFVKWHKVRHTRLLDRMYALGRMTHRERSGFWRVMCDLVDGNYWHKEKS